MAVKNIYKFQCMQSKRNLTSFSKQIYKENKWTPFHKSYYEVLDMFSKEEIKNLIISVPSQHGKLLPYDTPILTTKGWKSHGDLMYGDLVYGQDGKPKKVLGNTGIYKHPVWKMKFSDGKEILCSKEHLWRVNYKDSNGDYHQKIVEAQNIKGISYRSSPSITVNKPLQNKKIKLPIDPYILGCWLGDGHSRQGVLTIGSQDISHFGKLGESREVKKGIYRVLIKGLSKKLRLNNLLMNKHIPIEYLLACESDRIQLFKGLMDTDGTIDTRGNCEFTQKEGRLANDFYVLARSLGYKARKKTSLSKINGKVVGNRIRVFFNPNKTDSVFLLARKRDRLLNKSCEDRQDKNKLFINDFTYKCNMMGNCITVEGGMYLAGYDLIPTHNSEGSSRLVPAFVLGRNPDKRIGIGSYAQSFARKFNRSVQRIIDSKTYHDIFPETTLSGSNIVSVSRGFLRNADEFEVVDKKGGVKVVGRGGGLTGNAIDVMIMDDLYKDASEGNSPIIREQVKSWYTSVVRKRLHNDSQQLIVFTRWHEEDLVGYLEDTETVLECGSIQEIKEAIEEDPYVWIKINFEALKEGKPTELDPREEGEALWEEKHSREKHLKDKALDEHEFNCMSQGKPFSKKGLLYHKGFKTYEKLPEKVVKKANYTDTADQGKDNLCSICYDVGYIGQDKYIFVTDVIYTDEKMEETEKSVALMLNRNKTRNAKMESNSGGRGFARAVEKETPFTEIRKFHQNKNKESRVLTNASGVMNRVLFPVDWATRFPKFYTDLTRFKKVFSSNKFDDAPDALTGCYEEDILRDFEAFV